MSDEDMKAELERLRSENAAFKKGASDGIRMKVSEKGAVSVYGMGRFPVTLYKEQWLKLLNMSLSGTGVSFALTRSLPGGAVAHLVLLISGPVDLSCHP